MQDNDRTAGEGQKKKSQLRRAAKLSQRARGYEVAGYIHQAAACHIQRVNLYRLYKQRDQEMYALAQLGQMYDTLGNSDEAIEVCEQSLKLAQELRDRQAESMAATSLGMAYGHFGDARRMLMYGEQGRWLAYAIGNVQAQQFALNCLGEAYLSLDEQDQALPLYRLAFSLAQDSKVPYEMLSIGGCLGYAYSVVGDHQNALTMLNICLQQANEGSSLYLKGLLLAHVGGVYTQMRQFSRAEGYLQQAAAQLNKVHICRGDALLKHYGANLSYQQGQFVVAEKQYEQARKLFEDIQDRYSLARCLLDYAQLLRVQGREQDVISVIHTVLHIYRERGTEQQVHAVQQWLNAAKQE